MLIVKGCSETQGGESPESTTQQPLIQRIGSTGRGPVCRSTDQPLWVGLWCALPNRQVYLSKLLLSGNQSPKAWKKYFTFRASRQPISKRDFGELATASLLHGFPTRFR